MIRGSIVALVTPFCRQSCKVDWEALKNLVDWHVSEGTNAIVAVGTTGESSTLKVAEHQKIIQFVVSASDGRIPIVAGTGANSTNEALELTAAAKDAGADACLLVTPYYNKPTQEGLYQHFRIIAESVDIKQILYNVPSRTACNIDVDTVLRLADLSRVVGIKEASGDMERAANIIANRPRDFAVYSGDDPTARRLMSLGGDGNISVTANVVPKSMALMCDFALAGDENRAHEIDSSMRELHDTLFVESNPIPVKWVLSKMGMIENTLRLPLTCLSLEFHERVQLAMRRANITQKTST
jgi:4-hydroxy-tetrahydrodipicolinate synthase